MTSPGPLREADGGVVLCVHAQPGSKRDELHSLHDGRLRVRTVAPPVDGKANARLVALVAESFEMPRRAVVLVSGARSRRKELLLRGLGLAEARRRLAELMPSPAPAQGART